MVDTVIIESLSDQTQRQFIDIMSSANVGGGAAQQGNQGRGSSGVANQQRRMEEEKRKADKDVIRSRKSETVAVKDSTKAFEKAADAMRTIGRVGKQALRGAIEEYQTSVRTGAEAAESVTESLMRRAKILGEVGVTVQDFDRFSKAVRGAQLNLGGYDNLLAEVSDQQSFYARRLGNHTDALKFQESMIDRLTHSGLTASDFFGKFGKDLAKTDDRLLKLGVSYQESLEFQEETMETDSMRQKLLAATTKEQRQGIIQENKQRLEHLKTLGFSTEKAKELAKRFDEMAGKKAATRFEEAAKMEMSLLALGMDREKAAMAGEIHRRGARTKDEKDFMRQMFGFVEEQEAAAREITHSTGDMSKEIYTQNLKTAGAFDQYTKGTSDALNEGAKANTDAAKQTLETMKVIGQDTPILASTMETSQKILNVLENDWMAKGMWEIVGPLRDILTFLVSGQMLSGLTKVLGPGSGFFKSIKGIVAAQGGGVKGAGRLLGGVGLAGVAGYAAGTVLNKGLEKFAPEAHMKLSEGIGGFATKFMGVFDDEIDSMRSQREENERKVQKALDVGKGDVFAKNKAAAQAADKAAAAYGIVAAAGEKATEEQLKSVEKLKTEFGKLAIVAGISSEKQEKMWKDRLRMENERLEAEKKSTEAINVGTDATKKKSELEKEVLKTKAEESKKPTEAITFPLKEPTKIKGKEIVFEKPTINSQTVGKEALFATQTQESINSGLNKLNDTQEEERRSKQQKEQTTNMAQNKMGEDLSVIAAASTQLAENGGTVETNSILSRIASTLNESATTAREMLKRFDESVFGKSQFDSDPLRIYNPTVSEGK